MNNACPSCGAVYAVSAKDIGRKIRCKKCSSALVVGEDGLELDSPVAAPPAAVQYEAAEVEEDFDDDEEVVVTKSKKGKKAPRVGGGGSKQIVEKLKGSIEKLGGAITVVFGLGVFLVIWFTFQSKIGDAAIDRADAYVTKLQSEMDIKRESLVKPKAGATAEEAKNDAKKQADEMKKILEEYEPKVKDALIDARMTRIDNVRSVWFERWGTLFGFILVAFGCIGFLRTEQPLVVKTVAGAILTLMMLVVFGSFSSCGGDKSHTLPPMGAATGQTGGNKQGMPTLP